MKLGSEFWRVSNSNPSFIPTAKPPSLRFPSRTVFPATPRVVAASTSVDTLSIKLDTSFEPARRSRGTAPPAALA